MTLQYKNGEFKLILNDIFKIIENNDVVYPLSKCWDSNNICLFYNIDNQEYRLIYKLIINGQLNIIFPFIKKLFLY